MFQPTEQQVLSAKGLTPNQKLEVKKIFAASRTDSVNTDARCKEWRAKEWKDAQTLLTPDELKKIKSYGHDYMGPQSQLQNDLYSLTTLQDARRNNMPKIFDLHRDQYQQFEKAPIKNAGAVQVKLEKLLTIAQLAEIQHVLFKEQDAQREIRHREWIEQGEKERRELNERAEKSRREYIELRKAKHRKVF